MKKFKVAGKGTFAVHDTIKKEQIATIEKLSDGWALIYQRSGRREEYDTLAEARDAALKI